MRTGTPRSAGAPGRVLERGMRPVERRARGARRADSETFCADIARRQRGRILAVRAGWRNVAALVRGSIGTSVTIGAAVVDLGLAGARVALVTNAIPVVVGVETAVVVLEAAVVLGETATEIVAVGDSVAVVVGVVATVLVEEAVLVLRAVGAARLLRSSGS